MEFIAQPFLNPAEAFRAGACSFIIAAASSAGKATRRSQSDHSLKSNAMLHRSFTRFATIMTPLMLASVALAQNSTESSTPAPNVGVNRSYWFEICLVVVMVGGALWAVFRSSNRQ